jgi:arylsulfatase A-like enzyme
MKLMTLPAGLALFALLVCASKPVAAQSSAPNIIVILADDLGYADVGFTGCRDIPTPNIDRIARQGVVCTRGYVSFAVCGPSRAGLITGRYQDRFGFSRNPVLAPNDSTMGLPVDQQTIAELLKQKKYRTGAIGKWHLGAHSSQRPGKRGFDEFFGFLGGGHRYLPGDLILKDLSEARSENDGYKTRLLRNETRLDETEYLTDAFSREAVSFVEKNQRQPFFLYLAYNAPHSPLQATEKYLNRFANIQDPKRRTYAAMVSAVDEGVGKLLDKIQALHIENNTLIFFLSDNGGPISDNASSNFPFRGQKSDFFEGGIHVPFAVQWTGHLPAGTTYDQPVSSLDIFATAAALAKAPPRNALDGVNLLPYLTHQVNTMPHQELYWRNFDKQRYCVLSGQYKRIVEKDKPELLFDLSNDIAEKQNLTGKPESAALLESFENKLRIWKQAVINPLFLGLLEDETYSRLHPDRWNISTHK